MSANCRPLAIIPARLGSKGVPNKNFAPLPDGTCLVRRAINVANRLGFDYVLTTDAPISLASEHMYQPVDRPNAAHYLKRDPKLAQDHTPMRAVVEDVLAHYPGPKHQPVVLLQPTVPLRTLETVQKCLAHELPAATVSIVPSKYWRHANARSWIHLPARRQAANRLAILTGDAYVFLRGDGWPEFFNTVLVPESLNIDTMEDWDALIARLTPFQTPVDEMR